MTRRELLATAAAVPAAALKPTIRPDGPWVRVTVNHRDIGQSSGRTETTLYAYIEQFHLADLADGDTMIVESSEHGPITYTHVGEPGCVQYFSDSEFGYILGPLNCDGWFNAELKHKGDAS